MPQIEDIPESDRPRERLAAVGVENLSDQELLALVIEKGRSGNNVLQIAQNMLSHFGGLAEIGAAEIEELEEITGIGHATACKLKAAFRIGSRSKKEAVSTKGKIKNPEDIFSELSGEIADKKQEYFVLITLSARKHITSITPLFVGTLDAGTVHPREIFKKAVLQSAAHIAVAHNHPSGDPAPSQADRTLTQQIKHTGKLMEIPLYDHVIVTADDYYSFKENGII